MAKFLAFLEIKDHKDTAGNTNEQPKLPLDAFD